MAKFSQTSSDKLATCEPELQRLFETVVNHFDCTVLEGERTLEQQQRNVAKGVSKTLESKHIPLPGQKARAVDVAPFPLSWPNRATTSYVKDVCRYYYFGGFVLGIAQILGIKIRWGGDWNNDRNILDQNFDDLVHFELV
jgi:peptidoglycan L-alanyl-D-glutamate endopeptidase CwlK